MSVSSFGLEADITEAKSTDIERLTAAVLAEAVDTHTPEATAEDVVDVTSPRDEIVEDVAHTHAPSSANVVPLYPQPEEAYPTGPEASQAVLSCGDTLEIYRGLAA